MTQDTNPTLTDITGLHGICKIPNLPKIIVNTESKEECEKIIQQILTALDQYPKLKKALKIQTDILLSIESQNPELKFDELVIHTYNVEQENQKLKAEIEELNKHHTEHVKQINQMDNERSHYIRINRNLQQENNQLKQLKQKIEQIDFENIILTLQDSTTSRDDKNALELNKIQQILKGDSTS